MGGPAPRSSSLGGDANPLRGAYTKWITALRFSSLLPPYRQKRLTPSADITAPAVRHQDATEWGEALEVGQFSLAEPGHSWLAPKPRAHKRVKNLLVCLHVMTERAIPPHM